MAALFSTDFVLPVRPFLVEGPVLPVGPPLATASRGAWEARRLHLEASASGIELTFRSESAWLVNALVIAPEANLNALLTEADRLEEELALGSPEWMEKRKMISAPAPRRTARAETGSRARLRRSSSREPMERVYPHTRPEANEIGRPLGIQATPGEAAAATLGVVPLRPAVQHAADEYGPLRARRGPHSRVRPGSARGALLAADRQDTRPAGARCKSSRNCSSSRTGTRPSAHRGGDAPVLDHGARPGRCRTRAISRRAAFSADGVPPATVPVELTVLPFRLQTPPEKTFFMYSIFSET